MLAKRLDTALNNMSHGLVMVDAKGASDADQQSGVAPLSLA